MVAHIAIIVLSPALACSKPTSIAENSISVLILGTHSMFPLLAMICSKTLVAIDCSPFLRRVASVTTWVTHSRLIE